MKRENEKVINMSMNYISSEQVSDIQSGHQNFDIEIKNKKKPLSISFFYYLK